MFGVHIMNKTKANHCASRIELDSEELIAEADDVVLKEYSISVADDRFVIVQWIVLDVDSPLPPRVCSTDTEFWAPWVTDQMETGGGRIEAIEVERKRPEVITLVLYNSNEIGVTVRFDVA